MLRHASLAIAISAAALVTGPTAVPAQQDGLIAHPNVYRVQFENDWVRLVRVKVPGHANLSPHTHPPGYMLHVYFNGAEPIVFEHAGSPFTVTRPPVTARSYRIGRATPETHAVINEYAGTSDYMRVEFKTSSTNSINRRLHAPPLADTTSSVVEVAMDHYRATRVTIAAAQSLEIAADSAHPTLLLTLTERIMIDGAAATLPIGKEHFLGAGGKVTLHNTSGAPVQLLRVDLLTTPAIDVRR